MRTDLERFFSPQSIAVVGAMSAYISYATGRTTLLSLTAETLLVGIVMTLSFPTLVILMPYLVVFPAAQVYFLLRVEADRITDDVGAPRGA